MKLFYLVILLFLFSNCQRKDFFQASDDFRPYVQDFVNEGVKRGFNIQLEKGGLIIEFGTLPKDKAGKCQPNDYPKIITINETMWKDLDSFQRRTLIFHELGYCVLLRKHKNTLLPRGECASILDGKEEGFSCPQNLYSSLWWDYYLDELFNEKTEIPNWYKNELGNYYQNFRKEFLVNLSNPKIQLDTSEVPLEARSLYRLYNGSLGFWRFLELEKSRDFQIEMTFKTSSIERNFFAIQWNDLDFQVNSENIIITTQRNNNSQKKWGINTNFHELPNANKILINKLTIRQLDEIIYFFLMKN